MDTIDLSTEELETNYDKKIKKTTQKTNKFTVQWNRKKHRKSVQERNARTRRLIQIGALTEKYLCCADVDMIENFFKNIIVTDSSKIILRNLKNESNV